MTAHQGLGILARLRQHPRSVFLPDASSLGAALIELAGLSGHRQVTDLHLVDLAAVHDAVLVTFDRRIERSLGTADQQWVLTLV